MKLALVLFLCCGALAGCGEEQHRIRDDVGAVQRVGERDVLLLAFGSGSDERFDVDFRRSGDRSAVATAWAVYRRRDGTIAMNLEGHCVRVTVPAGIDPGRVTGFQEPPRLTVDFDPHDTAIAQAKYLRELSGQKGRCTRARAALTP